MQGVNCIACVARTLHMFVLTGMTLRHGEKTELHYTVQISRNIYKYIAATEVSVYASMRERLE